MIRINLLPLELRTLEKTPLSRFIIIIAGAALTTAAIFVFIMLTFSILPAAEQEREDIKKDVRQKKILAAKYDELDREIQFFRLRVDAVKTMSQDRYIWSKRLFQLHQVIEETEHVAIHGLSIEQGRFGGMGAGGAGSGMIIVLDGYSIIPELSSAADFMMNIRNSEFFKDCDSIKIGTTVIQPQAGSSVCKFSLRIVLNPPGLQPETGRGSVR